MKNKIEERILSILLALAMLLSLMPVASLTAEAAEMVQSGYTKHFQISTGYDLGDGTVFLIGSKIQGMSGGVGIQIWIDDVKVYENATSSSYTFTQNCQSNTPVEYYSPYSPGPNGVTGYVLHFVSYTGPIPVTGVSLNKNKTTLTIGGTETETLTVTFQPDSATNKNLTWASDNTAVATVSAAGVVTAVSAGKANITVTATNGTADTSDDKTATCQVTVKAPQTPVPYLDADGAMETCTDYTVVEAGTDFSEEGWYVVNTDVEITGSVNTSSVVNLILCDGKTLTASSGLSMNNSITIYGQSAGTGTLNVSNNDGQWAQGIYTNTLTINGGIANFTGSYCGISIGNTATINNGTVTATGGAEGIFAPSITINGGTVAAEGGDGANDSGINANYSYGTVKINDGIVIAISGTNPINGTVKNSIAGTGWTNKEGTGDGTPIEISVDGQDLSSDNYKRVQFGVLHTHVFTAYALNADGKTITATCNAEDRETTCPLSNKDYKATLTIAAPTTGSRMATLTGDTNVFKVSASDIEYSADNGVTWSKASPSDTGFYKARITVTDSTDNSKNYTATVSYGVNVISKAASFNAQSAHGDFTVPDVAAVGANVTIDITPDTGFEVDSITVTKSSGGTVSASVSGNKGSFVMPAESVTVSAAFVGNPTTATLKVTGSGTAELRDDDFAALTGSVAKKAGERFVLSVSPDDEYDYKIGFDPSREVSNYVEEFSKDDYAKYVAYAQKNNISLSFQTDMYWVTMPGVDGDKLDVNVAFEKVKSFTILYRPTGNADAVWCKFTKQTAGTENPFALEMKKDAVMGDQVVWSANVMAAFAPKEIAFAATSDSLKDASMTGDFEVKQSIQNESDWTSINNDGKFVVISGDVKTIVAAFVTDPSSMAVYDSETVTFDAPNSSTGIVHVITVCATDADGNVNSAGTLTALAAPTGDAVPTGKEFAGWKGFYFENLNSKASDKIYAAGDEIRVRENTTFYAVWNPVTLTVALDLNGGTGVGNTVSVEYGQALTISENPTKNGYDFGGWTVNKAVTENGVYFGRGSAFDTSMPITADLELTARWKHIHSYTYFKISDFGDLLEDYQSYESMLHIKICDCDDLAFEAHSFDSSGKCACGYRKLPETVTLQITYGKWDGTTYTPRMAEADRKVMKGQEVSVYAPGSLGPDMKFSKWQYSTDGSTWKDLASYTMVGFVIRADMQLRALYTNSVTNPQISMSATTYPVIVEGLELNTIMLQMDYQLPDGYYYVDSGVKASDNIGIAYYEMKEIKKTAGQKAALAGVKLGLSFLPGAGLGDFLVDQTMEAMNGPEYYYEKRENSVLDIMTAKTLSDYIYKGIPVNMEKFDPLYWDYRPDTKGQSGSLNALIPLNFVQKNNWNHYIYGIAWLRYKDKAGNIQTIYTPAIATTLDGVVSSTPVKQTGN